MRSKQVIDRSIDRKEREQRQRQRNKPTYISYHKHSPHSAALDPGGRTVRALLHRCWVGKRVTYPPRILLTHLDSKDKRVEYNLRRYTSNEIWIESRRTGHR